MDVVKAEGGSAMERRWNDQVDDYPPQLLAVLLMSVNTAALEWIDANLPKAFYRDMFLC